MVCQSPVGFARHNHGQCMHAAFSSAEQHCQRHGLRFTPVRRRALSILLEHHTALGAYDLLARLSTEGFGSKPPVVYRALTFLMEQGFVHRIEKLNAYIACAHPGSEHAPAFLMCSECGVVAEAAVSLEHHQLGFAADSSGFQIAHAVMEVEGRCPGCRV